MILAKFAAQVATSSGDGIGFGAGVNVKEGLFLDGIYMNGNCFFVDVGIQNAFDVLPHAADAVFAVAQLAVMRA